MAGFLFALPAIALVVGFIGVPIGQAVYYSFTEWNGLTSTWIGASAWTQAFHNSNLWTALQNNALLLLAVPFALGLPLLIAMLLHQRVVG
ncbi:membrane protein [mine drainage metagenome]|uniref:Membrane protein n=1 Tax=mine drainage metagenome TaxID=410659 RepID=T0ZZX6_9ZZZZ